MAEETNAAVLEAPKVSKPIDSIKAMMAPPVEGISSKPPEKIVEKATPVADPAQKKTEAPVTKTGEAVKEVEKVVKKPLVSEADEFEKTLTGKSKDRFVQFATERAQTLAEEMAAKRAEEIVAKKLGELPKADPELPKKFEETSKRALELEAELRKLGVERSPEFQVKFVERPKAIQAELSTILEDAEISKDEFFQHLGKHSEKASRAKLNEMLEEIGPLDRAQAFGLITEYLKIDKDKQAIVADPDTAMKILQEEQQIKVKAFVENLTKERDGAVVSTLPAFRKDAPLLFEGETGEIFAKDFDAKLAETNKLDLEQFPPGLRVQLIGSALMTKPLIEKVNAQAVRIVELQAQVDGFQKGIPGVGSGRTSSSVETEEKKDPLANAEETMGFRPGSMPRKRDRF